MSDAHDSTPAPTERPARQPTMIETVADIADRLTIVHAAVDQLRTSVAATAETVAALAQRLDSRLDVLTEQVESASKRVDALEPPPSLEDIERGLARAGQANAAALQDVHQQLDGLTRALIGT